MLRREAATFEATWFVTSCNMSGLTEYMIGSRDGLRGLVVGCMVRQPALMRAAFGSYRDQVAADMGDSPTLLAPAGAGPAPSPGMPRP